MGLENIENKILDEANAVRDQALKEAESEKEKILAKAKEDAAQILKESEEKANAETQKIMERGTALENVDKRKLVLEKKQEIIQNIFKSAGVDFEEHKRDLLAEVAKKLF